MATLRAEDHLGLVHAYARRVRSSEYDYDELVQIGVLGLMKAVEQYDPKKHSGFAFSTFACWFIRRAFLEAKLEARLVYIPEKAFKRMLTEGTLLNGVTTFEDHLDILADNAATAEDEINRQEEQRLVQAALKRLSPRERRILLLRYDKELTMAETGQKFGITKQAIHQIEQKALSSLRGFLDEAVES